MRIPNLNALKMFDAAARHLNFRLAAEEVSLTQGAVAQQVRRLESDLELQLFHRKPRGLELTKIGKTYHASIAQAFILIEEATQGLQPTYRQISISVTPSFATKWLVPRLAGFSEMHSNIDLQVVASEVLANFKGDEVDIAIRQGQAPTGKGIRSMLLANLDLCAVCSPKFAAEIAPIKEISDFKDYPLIQNVHGHWQALFGRGTIQTKHRILQFNQTAHAMDAAANGQGIALAPRLLIGRDLEEGKLVQIWQDKSANQDGYYLVWPDNFDEGLERDNVLTWIRSQVKSG